MQPPFTKTILPVCEVFPTTLTKPDFLLQRIAADSCIEQCHPLTVEPLWTCSLESTDRCRLRVCRGNNNNLKGVLLITLLSLFLYLLLSLPYCWALSVVLVNVLLSCLDVIYVTGCEGDLSHSSPNSFSLPSPTLPRSPTA